jgi:hypothetical protein
VSFKPSPHSYPNRSEYGWVQAYPQSALTVSGAANSRGISNQPTSAQHKANLSLLSDFLAKIPFPVRVTSAYRSPEVNAAVGGSSSSQHPNGLGVDISPTTISNRDLATWFYKNINSFPELDQAIFYTQDSHIHLGICPPGATGCVNGAPRHDFRWATGEGGTYLPWGPTPAEMAKQALNLAVRNPLKIGLLVAAGVGSVALIGGLFWVRRVRQRRIEIETE